MPILKLPQLLLVYCLGQQPTYIQSYSITDVISRISMSFTVKKTPQALKHISHNPALTGGCFFGKAWQLFDHKHKIRKKLVQDKTWEVLQEFGLSFCGDVSLGRAVVSISLRKGCLERNA